MNKRLWLLLAFLMCGLFLVVQAAQKTSRSAESPAKPSSATPGIKAAQAISTITGVAISPLLGVSAIGAWKYLHAEPEGRNGMPWFTRPWFWLPALMVVGICFAKDVMGPAIPLVLKKPMDAIEVFENKISGLIVAGAFVPLIALIVESAAVKESLAPALGLAMLDPALLLNALTVPVAIFAFLLVWMVSHVINVLIVVSPFATLDAALKSARLLVLSTVPLTSLANPYLGAVWAIALIIIAYFLAGWSFRLTIFGTVFSWDLLTLRSKRFKPQPTKQWVFTARKFETMPIRTYGKLSHTESGQYVLRYRPWLILPLRAYAFPDGQYVLSRGLLCPELLTVEGKTTRSALTFPPRFRTHEETLATHCGLSDIRDSAVIQGFKAIWSWLQDLFGFGRKPTTSAG